MHILHVWLCGPAIAALFLAYTLLVTANANAVPYHWAYLGPLQWPISTAVVMLPLVLVFVLAHVALITAHKAHQHRTTHLSEQSVDLDYAQRTLWSTQYQELNGFFRWQLAAFRPVPLPQLAVDEAHLASLGLLPPAPRPQRSVWRAWLWIDVMIVLTVIASMVFRNGMVALMMCVYVQPFFLACWTDRLNLDDSVDRCELPTTWYVFFVRLYTGYVPGCVLAPALVLGLLQSSMDPTNVHPNDPTGDAPEWLQVMQSTALLQLTLAFAVALCVTCGRLCACCTADSTHQRRRQHPLVLCANTMTHPLVPMPPLFEPAGPPRVSSGTATTATVTAQAGVALLLFALLFCSALFQNIALSGWFRSRWDSFYWPMLGPLVIQVDLTISLLR